MIVGGQSIYGFGEDFGLLVLFFVILLVVAVKLYPTLIQ